MLSASQCNGTMVARHQGKFPLASLNVAGEGGSKATTNYEARRHRPFSMAEIKRKNCVRGEYLWEREAPGGYYSQCVEPCHVGRAKGKNILSLLFFSPEMLK